MILYQPWPIPIDGNTNCLDLRSPMCNTVIWHTLTLRRRVSWWRLSSSISGASSSSLTSPVVESSTIPLKLSSKPPIFFAFSKIFLLRSWQNSQTKLQGHPGFRLLHLLNQLEDWLGKESWKELWPSLCDWEELAAWSDCKWCSVIKASWGGPGIWPGEMFLAHAPEKHKFYVMARGRLRIHLEEFRRIGSEEQYLGFPAQAALPDPDSNKWRHKQKLTKLQVTLWINSQFDTWIKSKP